MNRYNFHIGESYYYEGSTLSRDASFVTSTAVVGELSVLMENKFVAVPVGKDEIFFPDPSFVFHPLSLGPPVARNVEIDTLPSMRYRLSRPIMIIVSKEEGEIKAEIPDLELYTFASNEEEAIRELTQDLLDLCEDLLDISDEKLGQHPKKWKNYLKSIININA